MNQTVEVVQANTPERKAEAYAIRRRVFVEEQRVPLEIERDEDDLRAFHAIARLGPNAVGCGRFVPQGNGEVKIGRMAVLREMRGRDIGRAILIFLMEQARGQGFRRAVLHAQLSAEGFYLKQGFEPAGEVFEEAGIPHRKMERTL